MEAQTYPVSFPKCRLRLRCPVERCIGGVSRRTNLRSHFAHRHVQENIVILEEGNQPYPRCPQCDMFVAQKSLNGRHLATDSSQRGMERKWCRLVEEEARSRTDMKLTAYGVPLSQFTSFKYLGRVLAAEENEWSAVVCNLQLTIQNWAWLTQILSRE